eukprot:4075443-Pleurochrysis_carterae.AAC.1
MIYSGSLAGGSPRSLQKAFASKDADRSARARARAYLRACAEARVCRCACTSGVRAPATGTSRSPNQKVAVDLAAPNAPW